MTFRFPLYAKIVIWFLMNLVLLAVVFGVILRLQFRPGLDVLLANQAGERIEPLTEVIVADLGDRPIAEWDGVLDRFSSAYRVKFYLFRNDGGQLAGDVIHLPSEVRSRLVAHPRPPNPPRPLRPGSPPPMRGDGSPDRRPEHRLPPDGGPPGQPPKLMVRTSDPSRYWLLTRVALNHPERRHPATLIAMSDTLTAGGLFFDVAPWLWAGAGVLLLSALFWLPLVRGITQAISQMTRATEQIAEGRFDTRVGTRRTDELGRLGAAINHMAARLAGFVTGQKRFLGDIAHELCSPIARMQVALGILEQRADEKQKAYVNDVREEAQHMSSLVNELLSFSKASLGATTIQLQPVPLIGIVDEVLRREATPEISPQVEVPGHLAALAEPELLKRALANLVRNAIRYAGQAGPITVSASGHRERVTLTVSDCGPGVPEETLSQLFDPFYRVETSRARESGGVGLGLTIVKNCIEACRGTVACRNLSPTGFQVEIVLQGAEMLPK